MWRIHQYERFGEPQDVLHTGKDVAVCKEVQRPARVWAKGRADDYKVREVNGQEEIEHRDTGSGGCSGERGRVRVQREPGRGR